jgi:GMP synthase-like glutamine amidotransferase
MVPLKMPPSERVLVVENEHGAGPEMFQHWLARAGVEVDIWRPYAGRALAEGLGGGGLIVLGGEMGACDDHRAPWLAQVRAMLQTAATQGRPVLGICLGAQMLAAACGGRVEPSLSGGELGLCRIELSDECRNDRLFGPMATPVETVQWHNDEITELPSEAVLLASSSRCAVQAYRIGSRAWGVQFHPEVKSGVLQVWADAEQSSLPARRRQLEDAIAEVSSAESRLFACWQGFAERFADVVREG